MNDLNMPKNLTVHKFDDRDALAEVFSSEIAHQLDRAIQIRGHATIAVSGGQTPLKMFKLLSQAELDWTRVTVTLVDERWVSPDDERSNERLVKENLLVGRAAFAHFIPLYVEGRSPEEASLKLCQDIVKLPLPFDVIILGMGTDGHTASYFSDADNLSDAVNPVASMPVVAINSVSAGEPRITLTMPMLMTGRFIAVHIEGQNKWETISRALDSDNDDYLPIRHVLDHKEVAKNIFWSP
jgi:6-phosphogluconolactonase